MLCWVTWAAGVLLRRRVAACGHVAPPGHRLDPGGDPTGLARCRGDPQDRRLILGRGCGAIIKALVHARGRPAAELGCSVGAVCSPVLRHQQRALHPELGLGGGDSVLEATRPPLLFLQEPLQPSYLVLHPPVAPPPGCHLGGGVVLLHLEGAREARHLALEALELCIRGVPGGAGRLNAFLHCVPKSAEARDLRRGLLRLLARPAGLLLVLLAGVLLALGAGAQSAEVLLQLLDAHLAPPVPRVGSAPVLLERH
mmetsp:Transcript_28312/g.90192  ORF Transcript_28312/g.90192 Transcript_28312/m.90192 type:complete len:255 (+) Transcript_28312:465-1229(+)